MTGHSASETLCVINYVDLKLISANVFKPAPPTYNIDLAVSVDVGLINAFMTGPTTPTVDLYRRPWLGRTRVIGNFGQEERLCLLVPEN